MPMIQTTLMGNLGTEPEYRLFPSGKELTKFRVCSSKSRQNEQGDWEQVSELWVDVECWGRIASPAAHALRCGMSVILVGHFYTDVWEVEDNGVTSKRSQVKFKAQFVGSDVTRSLLRVGAGSEDSAVDTAADNRAAAAKALGEEAESVPF